MIIRACLIRYDELKEILIVSQRIQLNYEGELKIVLQPDLEVQLLSTQFKLQLHPMHYAEGIKFLEKKPLKSFCSIKLQLEIKD